METKITVRYAETDQMGIVHHSNYPVWFELGRTDLLREAGFSYSYIEGKGVLMPLLRLNCRFKKPARYEEILIVKTRISHLSHAKIAFKYTVHNMDSGVVLAEGETEHGLTDRNFKPVILEKDFPELFEKLKAQIYPE